MTDQVPTDEFESSEIAPDLPETPARTSRRRNRTRTILAAILVVLVLLLLGLTVFVIQLLNPPGAPSSGQFKNGYRWIRSIYGWGKLESQQLYSPTDVGVGPDGTIWVTDPARYRVLGFYPDGSYKTLIHQGPFVITPQAIGVDNATGNVYIADYSKQKIWVVSPANKVVRSWDIPLPTEVAVQGNRVAVGTVYGIALFDLQGNRLAYWGSRGKKPTQFDVVRGIAFGPDGTIYCSDTQNARLKAYTPDGKLKWLYPTADDLRAMQLQALQNHQQFVPPFQLPAGMTFDARGRLILVDPFAFQILVVDPANGHITARYGDYGTQDGYFSYPTSIAYDSTRDWFAVADTDNDRAQIVHLPNSGANPLVAGAARFFDGPVWICAVPLILLVIAAIIYVTQRRRRRAAELAAGEAESSEDSASESETEA